MVNKLFLRKKLYLLRMRNGDSITKHLNAFNIVINQLLSIDKEKRISLLCSLSDSWDNLVKAIGSNNITLKIDDVVTTLLAEEMR